ncbi:DUF1566 domain-containing protein [Pseudoxanthomonas sp. LH2527]|uniref:Lcl C-terminal domain-containing protein n=1 Tax=Pseudoxanthomonas sp. LH2527 TaxID=2923249 RepID=UPI001F133428|nr:DUF1566 domain-containing protein [Pseudoxanthomonas sp. LH2527]MCH6484265.1 DUF1566 domain-containing protein [Pseudoxanthomonas sp. LH2527]
MSNAAARVTYPTGDAATSLTVVDTTAGLEWLRKPLAGRYEHQQAIDACEAVALVGGGFRLPTRAELLTLVDITKFDPAIDTEAFPDIKGGWFWTSDLCAWSSASAWYVYFNYGGVYYSHRNYDGFALAVRRVGQ